MTSANDYSRYRGPVSPPSLHDYAAVMEYCKDTRNWFKRARGEWYELQRVPRGEGALGQTQPE